MTDRARDTDMVAASMKKCVVEMHLMRAGRDCTVLIHEATMEDDLVEDAVEKKHRFDVISCLFILFLVWHVICLH